jgi:hypothetical protein
VAGTFQGEVSFAVSGVPIQALNLKTCTPEFGAANYSQKPNIGCSWLVTASNGGGVLSITATRWDRGNARWQCPAYNPPRDSQCLLIQKGQ